MIIVILHMNQGWVGKLFFRGWGGAGRGEAKNSKVAKFWKTKFEALLAKKGLSLGYFHFFFSVNDNPQE